MDGRKAANGCRSDMLLRQESIEKLPGAAGIRERFAAAAAWMWRR
jgi:hypothetical protein